MTRLFSVAAIMIALAGAMTAQSVISARSGLVHYTQGQVFLADKEINPKFAQFPEMKEGDVLRTGEGLVEVLLNPGVFLRLAENSSVKMINNRLSDARIELLSGSALIECAEIVDGNSITLLYKDASIDFRKPGLFRIDAETGLVRAYDGQVSLTANGQALTLKEGKQTTLGTVLTAEKFDKNEGDPFYRWAARRASYLSAANIPVARSLRENDTLWARSGWLWNPWLGSFTFIPARGIYNSAFGFPYYAPQTVLRVYVQPRPIDPPPSQGMHTPAYNPSYGYNTGSRDMAVHSSGPVSSPATSSAPAVSERPSGGASTGRGDGGGRGR